jgi:formylglycine-generating enzyme
MDQTEITNNEYRQFVNWVIDSIAREKIYVGLEEDEEAQEYINYRKRYFNEGAMAFEDFDPSNRSDNRAIFALNWDQMLDHNDEKNEQIMPLLAEMYYAQPERFYKKKEIDTRKLNFKYFLD